MILGTDSLVRIKESVNYKSLTTYNTIIRKGYDTEWKHGLIWEEGFPEEVVAALPEEECYFIQRH